jgi:hypothetical protein
MLRMQKVMLPELPVIPPVETIENEIVSIANAPAQPRPLTCVLECVIRQY